MPCEDHTSGDTLAFPVGNYVNAALGNYVNENLLNLGNYLNADTELRELAELRDSEVLTDEEFNELKQRVLAR